MKLVKENYKKICMYIGLFLILFYPFNISFKDVIYPNEYVNLIVQIVGLLLVILPNYRNILENLIKHYKVVIITGIVAILLIFFRNGDIQNRHFGMPFYILEFFAILLIFSSTKEWQKIFTHVFMFFIIEHIIGTWFCFIFKNFYYSNILPIFSDFKTELLYQFEHNQIAGFTHHYSTNATYLLQGIIFEIFYLNYNIKNSKKNIINYIILALNVGAILLTGKRAQLFFGVLAILIAIILKNKGYNIKILKKYYKQISIAMICGVAVILIVPAFRGPIVRAYEGFINKDMFLTREPMKNLAINKFKESPVFGKGWGTYKYYYHNEIITQERSYMDAHNIYLQILSELGVFGIAVFIGLNAYIVILVLKVKNSKNISKKSYLYVFLAYHIYILLEGIVGNSFYDIPVLIPYGFFWAMMLNLKIEGENNERKNIDD